MQVMNVLKSQFKQLWTPTMLLKLSQSCIYYLAFLTFGFSNSFIAPTLLWLVNRLDSNLFTIGFAITCRMVGGVICSPIIGRLYQWCEGSKSNFSQQQNSQQISWKSKLPNFIILAAFPLLSILLPLVPLVFHWSLLLLHGIALGMVNAIINVGCNVMMTKLWKDRAASYVTFLHFMFGMGLFLGPLYLSLFNSNHSSSDSSSNSKSIELVYYSAGIVIVPIVMVVMAVGQVLVTIVSGRVKDSSEENSEEVHGSEEKNLELKGNDDTNTSTEEVVAVAAGNEVAVENEQETTTIEVELLNRNEEQAQQQEQQSVQQLQQEQEHQVIIPSVEEAVEKPEPQPQPQQELAKSKSSVFGTVCNISNIVALVTGMAMVCVSNSENLIMSFMGAFIEKQVSIAGQATSNAYMLSVLWFSFTMGRLFSSILSQFIKPFIMLLLLLIIHGAAIAMWILIPGTLPYVALSLLGLGLSAQFPLVFSYPVTSSFKNVVEISTTMNSIMLMMPTIAALIIPNVTTFIVQNYGYDKFFYIVGASFAAQLVWILVLIVLSFRVAEKKEAK